MSKTKKGAIGAKFLFSKFSEAGKLLSSRLFALSRLANFARTHSASVNACKFQSRQTFGHRSFKIGQLCAQ